MPLYFAYGSNMVPEQMAMRCPAARLLGTAVLAGHRFGIIRGGHGSVLRRRGAYVHGVLWRVSRGDQAALDRYEEVFRGLYRRERRVVRAAGRTTAATVYVAAATAPGRPRTAYIAAIIAAAREFGFPAGYVAALEAIACTA
ncbi:MAG TPA: gamma-glutamylcyclotransferase family protein [Stellaceae bacterium]|nr:gamma-glutamylcyclotransferase family protein [Stellaceae bacterium]